MKFLFAIVVVLAGGLLSLTNKEAAPVTSGSAAGTPGKAAAVIPGEFIFTVSKVINSRVAVKGVAGYSKSGKPIEAFYFPGSSERRALVIGGVHGSELSAIDVARNLVAQLAGTEGIYYSVIVIPCLFPDNAERAVANPALIGSVYNLGRYSHDHAPDPNRQMPALGEAFHADYPIDYAGRTIEPENQLLLRIIQEFLPQRVVNLHAIRSLVKGGIYADPRTDNRGLALEYASDSSLAIAMAWYINTNGGQVPGNNLHKRPTTLYPTDPPVAAPGSMQRRNLSGSRLPGNRGHGVSLGGWASTAVDDPALPAYNRPAMRLLTVEFPGYKRPVDYNNAIQRQHCKKQVELYASAIKEIFLTNLYVEE